ncbi:hypothetical protein D3C80_1634360 [compost metagenome]
MKSHDGVVGLVDTLLGTPAGCAFEQRTPAGTGLAANTIEVDLLRLAGALLGVVLLRFMPRVARQVGTFGGVQVIQAGNVGLRAFRCIQIFVVTGAVEVHRKTHCIAHFISLWIIPPPGQDERSKTFSNPYQAPGLFRVTIRSWTPSPALRV